jgi:hypothetical protein
MRGRETILCQALSHCAAIKWRQTSSLLSFGHSLRNCVRKISIKPDGCASRYKVCAWTQTAHCFHLWNTLARDKSCGVEHCVCRFVDHLACVVGTFGVVWKVFDRSEQWLVCGAGLGLPVYKVAGGRVFSSSSSRDLFISPPNDAENARIPTPTSDG